MTDLADMIASRASMYATEAQRAALRVAELVAHMVDRGGSKSAIIEQLSNPAVIQSLKVETGWGKAADKVLGAYGRTVLGNLKAAGGVTEGMLQGLMTSSQRSFLAWSDQYFSSVMAELTKNVLAGVSQTTLKAAVSGLLPPHQLEALVNTSLSTYSRSVRFALAEGEPADTLYIYEGPADDRTRDECLEMMAAGELTRDEIFDKFGNAFIDGGGYNCRHQWVRVAESYHTDQAGAKKLIEGRDG